MLTDDQVKELWGKANPFPQWETWQKNYGDFLEKVRKLSDEELARPENQKLVWSADAITPLGPGGFVKIDGAFTDPEIVNAVVGLRRRAWPKDPTERSDAMWEEGERILALVSPKHSSRRPQARLWRLFAALLPEDFHCVFNYQAQLHVSELLLHEGSWHSHVLIRDRLRKVLGPERDLAEHVRRSTFCWWLHENYDAIKRGEQPVRSTSILGSLKPITLWPYTMQLRGNFTVKRMVEAYRDVMKTALPGVPRSDLLDLLGADEEFKSLSLSSRRGLLSRLAGLGFLEEQGGLLRPTREGQELLERDVPDILVQRLLERIFPFAHLLRKLKEGPQTRRDLVAYQQELYPSWTTPMMPNSQLDWARDLELVERVDGRYKLSDYGAAWEARLPAELPRPPENSDKMTVEEVEEEEQESSQPSESAAPARPWPNLAARRARFAEDPKARGFVLDEAQLAALHHAWHCNPLKRFVILAGLSGTGKTALVQHYARLYCESLDLDVSKHLEVVAVSPDWKDPTGLLGYFNALHEVPSFQVEPALRLLLEARRNPRLPYFLLLDEMNLARVEQYFAPFLSSMETGLPLALHGQDEPVNGVPPRLPWQKNLFIAGTVNMDETTFPFSDKVLDRAFTLEFWDVDLDSFLESRKAPARQPDLEQVLREVHKPLRAIRRHFGYRTAHEVLSFVENAGTEASADLKQKLLDQALFSKVLPRLRGEDTPELRKTFEALLHVCEGRALQRCGEKLKQMQSTLVSVGFTRLHGTAYQRGRSRLRPAPAGKGH